MHLSVPALQQRAHPTIIAHQVGVDENFTNASLFTLSRPIHIGLNAQRWSLGGLIGDLLTSGSVK